MRQELIELAAAHGLPKLYSFRRCPYAIRARMALLVADIAFELIEVELKNKPAELYLLSAKATVPVLALADDRVIDESREIIAWALSHRDPEGWLDCMRIEPQSSLPIAMVGSSIGWIAINTMSGIPTPLRATTAPRPSIVFTPGIRSCAINPFFSETAGVWLTFAYFLSCVSLPTSIGFGLINKPPYLH